MFWCYMLVISNADVVKLEDTMDLGSIARACRFKSCHPHHLISGIIYGYKLNKVKDNVIEGTAKVEEISLELDSEGIDKF